jgi:hypothetical protein
MGYVHEPVSREEAARQAGEELAAYAFIRAMMAGDSDRGLLLAKEHHVSDASGSFVLGLVRAAQRALLTAEGYNVEAALSSLDQWMDDAAARAAT